MYTMEEVVGSIPTGGWKLFQSFPGSEVSQSSEKTQSLQKLDTASRIANNYTQAIGTSVFAVVVVRISTIKHMIHVVNVA